MDVGGVTRSLQLLAENLKPAALKAPLREISKAKQAHVRQVFEQGGPGWEPRTASTLSQEADRLSAQADAQSRAGKAIAARLFTEHKNAIKRGAGASTIARRSLERAVLAQLRGKSLTSAEAGLLAAADSTAIARTQARLFARVLGVQEHTAGRLLGRLASSIKARIEGTLFILESTVKWAGVHNYGGAAGNGAQIPRRSFLAWRSEDLEMAAAAFQRHMIRAIVG